MPPDSIDAATTRLRSAAPSESLELRKFTDVLCAALTSGAGALADANPCVEAANILALRTAQNTVAVECQPQALLSLYRTG